MDTSFSVATPQRGVDASVVAAPNFVEQFSCIGHTEAVSTVKFSPDGRLAASASADKTARVWEMAGGRQEVELVGHEGGLSDVAWSSTSSSSSILLATAADDKTVRLWDVQTSGGAALLNTLDGHSSFVFCVAFNPQSNIVASGSFDETVRLWDVRTGKCIKVLPAHRDPVTSVHFNREGNLLVTSSYDGLCRIWETDTGQCLKTLVDDNRVPITHAIFSPNGRYLLVSTLDSRIRLWNHSEGKCFKTYTGHRNERFTISSAFCVSGAGKYVVSGSEDHNVYVWDLQKKMVLQRLEGHSDIVLAVTAHPTENVIASTGLDKTIRVWRNTS